MEFELDLEGETRCDEKLRARIRGQLWGKGGRSWKGPDSRGMKAAKQRRITKEVWEGQPRSVLESSKS